MTQLSSMNKEKQRIEKSNKEMVANFYYKRNASLVSKKVIIKLKQKLISVSMYLDMKINTCIKFIRSKNLKNYMELLLLQKKDKSQGEN